MTGLIVSLVALLLVALAAARHILKQRRAQRADSDVNAGPKIRAEAETKPGEDV